MNRLVQWLAPLEARLAPLSARERALVLLLPVILLTLLLADTLDSARKQQQRLHQQIDQTHKETLSLIQQQELLANQLSSGDENRRNESLHLQQELNAMVDKMVSPEDMGQIVRRVLAADYRVKVLSLTNNPPEPVAPGATPRLFRHGLTLEIEGGYFDVIRYLRALEQQGGVYWKSLQYEVSEFPKNRVKIEVFTIGQEEVLLRA